MTNGKGIDVTEDSRVDVVPKYWGNVLSAFEAGVQMDLRLRLAMDFLKSPFAGEFVAARAAATGTFDAHDLVCASLNVATALLDEAAARGLVKDLPDTGEINSAMRHHVERSARAQVEGQSAANRAMREAQGGVVPVGASAFPGMNG